MTDYGWASWHGAFGWNRLSKEYLKKMKAKKKKTEKELKSKVKKHEKKEDTVYRKLQRENKKFEREIK